MKNKIITTAVLISANVLFTPQLTCAKTIKLSAEEVKLQKDARKYKAYIPKKYVLFEAIEGDLNKDAVNDLVLIVKATDPKQWVKHEYRGKLDRNRRGMIVLINHNGTYQPIATNLSGFSSENEEGGVYFAPELSVTIEKGILNVQYGHGRYGAWSYHFRVQNHDLRLIGYDRSDHDGPYVQSSTSINLLTNQKVLRKNMNTDREAEPQFKQIWSKVNFAPIYLSKIQDFDELNF